MKFEIEKLKSYFLCFLIMTIFIFFVKILQIPNPMMILIIPIIYFSYKNGYVIGLLGGIMSIIYSAYLIFIENKDPQGILKLIVIVFSVYIIIVLIQKLKDKDRKNIIELMRLNEDLVLAATTDNLTGAANRHSFLETAKTLFDNSVKLKRSISVLFIDIDYFKKVNDTYSHEFGDVVLAHISRIIAKCLRTSDLSCRYGGDEFVVLLSIADDKVAENVAKRMMKEMNEARFEQYPDFRLYVSIGVAYRKPENKESLEELINRADVAMYKAKEDGRNKISINRENEA